LGLDGLGRGDLGALSRLSRLSSALSLGVLVLEVGL
jgi:hypothetical protein